MGQVFKPDFIGDKNYRPESAAHTKIVAPIRLQANNK